MGKPEGTVERYLKKQGEAKGFLVYKFAPSGVDGVPDRILIGHGHTVFVETKAPDGAVRPLQRAIISDMIDHGGYVYVVNTKEKVDQLLDILLNTPVHPRPISDQEATLTL